MVGQAGAPQIEKTNPYPVLMSIPGRIVFPQGWKGSEVVSLPSGAWLVSLKGSVFASAAGRLSNQHTPGTCFASSEWQTTEARGLQLIKSSGALAYSLVDNKMRHKSLCILRPRPEIH